MLSNVILVYSEERETAIESAMLGKELSPFEFQCVFKQVMLLGNSNLRNF